MSQNCRGPVACSSSKLFNFEKESLINSSTNHTICFNCYKLSLIFLQKHNNLKVCSSQNEKYDVSGFKDFSALSAENDILERDELIFTNNVAVSSKKSNIVASIDPTYKYKSNCVEGSTDSSASKEKHKGSFNKVLT